LCGSYFCFHNIIPIRFFGQTKSRKRQKEQTSKFRKNLSGINGNLMNDLYYTGIAFGKCTLTTKTKTKGKQHDYT